jgi:hypothetical protein
MKRQRKRKMTPEERAADKLRKHEQLHAECKAAYLAAKDAGMSEEIALRVQQAAHNAAAIRMDLETGEEKWHRPALPRELRRFLP